MADGFYDDPWTWLGNWSEGDSGPVLATPNTFLMPSDDLIGGVHFSPTIRPKTVRNPTSTFNLTSALRGSGRDPSRY